MRLPPEARAVLENGILCYLAVRTGAGPHLTPVVYVLDGDRLWLTTSRSSVKARAWRRDPTVAGLVRFGEASVSFRGRVSTYDALDPASWPGAVITAPRLVRAAARFSLRNARFFAGYAVDAPRVPLAWTPPGRVFVRVDLQAGHVLGEDHDVMWGRWAFDPPTYRRTFDPHTRGRLPRLPGEILEAMGRAGIGAAAFQSKAALTVLPAAWSRVPREGAYYGGLPRRVYELAGPRSGEIGAFTVDRASAWRAARMTGALLQGRIEAFASGETVRGVPALRARLAELFGDADGDVVLLRLRPDRAVWWQGWASGTASGAA